MAITAAKLIAQFGADTTAFDNGARHVSGKLGQMGSEGAAQATRMSGAFSGLGAQLARIAGPAAIGAVIVSVAKTGIAFNAMMEQSTMAFTTMLGSAGAAKTMLSDLTSFAAKTPFELNDLVPATQRLMAFGFAAKDVIPMLTSVGNAAAAMGGSAEMIDRITRAIGQMQAKGKVQSQEMLQLAEAGIPAWKYLADVLGTDVAGAMKKVELGGVDAATGVKAIMAGMDKNYAGMMEKQATTFNGLMSTMKDNLRLIAGDLTEPVFQGLKAGVEKFNAYLPTIRGTIQKGMASWFGEGGIVENAQKAAKLAVPNRAYENALASVAKLEGQVSDAESKVATSHGREKAQAVTELKRLTDALEAARSKAREAEIAYYAAWAAASGVGHTGGYIISASGSLAQGLAQMYGDKPKPAPVIADTELNKIKGQTVATNIGNARLATEEYEAGLEAAKQFSKGFESGLDKLKSAIKGAMSPTSVDEFDTLSAKLGKPNEHWDEYRRRMQDIANLGGASPWAAKYGIGGSADEIKWQALKNIQKFDMGDYSMLSADEQVAMKDKIKEQARQTLGAQAMQDSLINSIAGEMGLGVASPMVDSLGAGIKDKENDVKAVGAQIVSFIASGAKESGADLSGYLLDLLLPGIIAWLSANGYGGGKGWGGATP